MKTTDSREVLCVFEAADCSDEDDLIRMTRTGCPLIFDLEDDG